MKNVIRPLDWLVAGITLATACMTFFLGDTSREHTDWFVVAAVNGVETARWRLPLDAYIRQDTLTGPLGHTVVRSDSAGVVVVSASCPHRWCMKSGRMTPGGSPIVCAPNRTIIRLVPESNHHNPAETDVDGVTQ